MKYQSNPGFEAYFGLIFTLVGFIILIAGLHPDIVWSGQRPSIYFLIPFCSIFIFVGFIPVLFRRNFEIDEVQQKIVSYKKIIKKFDVKEFSFRDISSLEIVENHQEGKNSYELLILNYDQTKSSVLKAYSKLLLFSLQKVIESKVFKNSQDSELVPVSPSTKAIQLYREGTKTYIELPSIGLINQPLFWIATLPLAGFTFISTLFVKTLESDPPLIFNLVFIFPLIVVLILLALKFCVKTMLILDHKKLKIIKSFLFLKKSTEVELDHIVDFSSPEDSTQSRRLFQSNLYSLSIIVKMQEIHCGYFKNIDDVKYVTYLIKSKKQA